MTRKEFEANRFIQKPSEKVMQAAIKQNPDSYQYFKDSWFDSVKIDRSCH